MTSTDKILIIKKKLKQKIQLNAQHIQRSENALDY